MSDPVFAHNPPINPGLKQDRAVLLAIRDILAGSAQLNWSESLAMFEWHGITLRGSPPRVTELKLRRSQLIGRIPPGTGLLTDLKALDLEGNHLTGCIPSELGDLLNLRRLNLRGNRLTGSIPMELDRLRGLMFLNLAYNLLSGSLPLEVRRLLRESEYYRERGRSTLERWRMLGAFADGSYDLVYDEYGNCVYD